MKGQSMVRRLMVLMAAAIDCARPVLAAALAVVLASGLVVDFAHAQKQVHLGADFVPNRTWLNPAMTQRDAPLRILGIKEGKQLSFAHSGTVAREGRIEG